MKSTKKTYQQKLQPTQLDRPKWLLHSDSIAHSQNNETILRNIDITGMNSDDDMNAHKLFTVGKEIVAKMEGQLIFS